MYIYIYIYIYIYSHYNHYHYSHFYRRSSVHSALPRVVLPSAARPALEPQWPSLAPAAASTRARITPARTALITFGDCKALFSSALFQTTVCLFGGLLIFPLLFQTTGTKGVSGSSAKGASTASNECPAFLYYIGYSI